MASEDMGLVQAQQRLDNGLNHPHLVFQDTYNCGPPPAQRRASATASSVGEHKTTTRELTGGFIDHHQQQHHYFHQPTTTDFRRAMFSSAVASAERPHQDSSHNWNLRSRASATPSGDGSEEDEDDVEDDDEDDDNDDENEVEGLVRINDSNNSHEKSNNNRSKMGYQKSKQLTSFGLKEGDVLGRSGNPDEDNGMRNAVTVANADGELYYSQYMQGAAEMGPNAGQKDVMVVENGCGFSGRKESLYLSESGESLRTILSDPLTGSLMDDAMILPCGHSFGSGGIQHILRMKLCPCPTCSKPVSEDSISPNLSLRAAVQAFRREEEMQVHRVSKRRRDRYDQVQVPTSSLVISHAGSGTYGDAVQTDHSRGRGVQFPFAVTDRVIIKGNKRTPPRFVGREAIVTTQCLNGWYVVKTLDNAESVKLQYRSLAKVPDNASPKPISSKMTTPNWLQAQHLT